MVLLLVVDITPTLMERVIGIALALMVVGLSIYLILRQQRRNHEAAAAGSPATNLAADTSWRTPVALLMGLCGILVLIGVFVDPKAHPKEFVYLWTTIALVMLILLPIAGYDLLIMRRRAYHERVRLLEEHRVQVQRDLREARKRRFADGRPGSSNTS